MKTTVYAPGKLMLVGEYAVLDGAPAIAIALERGVQCEVTPAHAVQIETPDGDDRFVAPALEQAPAAYRFSDWNPTDLADKPGFGGSAAACVAACIAAGRPASDAVGIHRNVQGGGSGVDVAVSIHGGMIRFEDGHVHALEPVTPVVIWSGQSARTQPLVNRYLAWSDRTDFVVASREIVDGFQDNPIEMLHENAHLLMHMGTQTGIPYMTPSLAGISGLARRFGGAAKPSGAGAGDCAVALFPDPEAQSGFEAACAERGRVVIPVIIAGPAHATSATASG